MGYKQTEPVNDKDLLQQAQRMYHVFHIHINSTSYRNDPNVIGYWRDMLGENLLILDDHTALAELIATTVALVSGVDLNEVTSSFDASTAKSVKNALVNVSTGVRKSGDKGVINL